MGADRDYVKALEQIDTKGVQFWIVQHSRANPFGIEAQVLRERDAEFR